ncbi:hypothetical protein D9Q98_006260 [Chlorella vulgaris]|uniref:Uncharacterized protein n=1 Tax=Chlorella vulgaris TaxID=3077 RepID=A0A9D4TXT5_CHLVU|nr:hypothetical protein D9Q98_006260 [Chlorella vulgaris]
MSAICASARPVALATRTVVCAQQQTGLVSKPSSTRAFLPARSNARVQRRAAVQPQASAVEVAQLAGEAGFIFGVGGVMCGLTLIGLALGFVLLRVESLAEEGKI